MLTTFEKRSPIPTVPDERRWPKEPGTLPKRIEHTIQNIERVLSEL